jgi:BirA family transcriptional regulator, biotin operon repressor / biotin---[acetyl-CoA-carboxylase] ligase
MHLPDPAFPPLLKGHAVRAPKTAFAEAQRRARDGSLGAGDLVWSRGVARAELAIVLEPEVPLTRAVQMAPLMMTAFGDCLGALFPPKVAIHYRWPGTILLNGAAAGEVRVAAANAPADSAPAWLVVGAAVDIAAPRKEREEFSRTSVAEEGGGAIGRTDILQSLAAHFLTWLNTWQDDGFRPVHDQWLFRAEGREKPVAFPATVTSSPSVEGVVLGLDESANLLLRDAEGKVTSLVFLEHVTLVEPVVSAS